MQVLRSASAVTRKRLSPKQRAELLAAHNCRCHLCPVPIKRGDRWEVSHVIPLELGGADDDANRAPAHFKCHRWQTSMVDIPAIAKSKRIIKREHDLYRPRRPLPGGRDDTIRKRMDGTVVDRATGLPWRGTQ
jgi:5-methylcytosine-specific restriction protein A